MPPLARLVALLLTALLLAAPLHAAPDKAEEPVEVTVHMKDGRTLTGLLLGESAEEVTLRLAFGDVPLKKAEISRIDRPQPDAGEEAGPGPAEPRTERMAIVTLLDRTKRRGKLRDRGSFYELETELGAMRIPKGDVAHIRYEEVVVAPEPEPETPAAERERMADYGLGIEVTRPGEAWRFVEHPTEPGARMELVHQDPVVVLRIALVEPLPEQYRDVVSENLARVKERVTDELRGRYRAHRGLTLEQSSFSGLPAWRITYEADARTDTRHRVQELRFHLGGDHIAVRAHAPFSRKGSPDERIDGLLRSVSFAVGFLGGIDLDGRTYANLELGVRLEAPPGWRLVPRLLDDGAPLELLPPDGVGRYRLESRFAEGVATADAAIERFEDARRLRSAFYVRERLERRSLEGAPAVELVFRDYADKERQRLVRTRRLLWVRSGQVVELVGVEPATGEPDEERRHVVDRLFESVAWVSPERPRHVLAEAERLRAMRYEAGKLLENRRAREAIALLDEALAAMPSYGVCYVLRGECYAELEEYRAALKDLERAAELVPDPQVTALMAEVQNAYAKDIAESDWEQARQLFERAIANDPENRRYRQDLVSGTVERARDLTDEDRFDDAIDLLSAAQKDDPGEDRYQREILRAYHLWIRELTRGRDVELRDLYKARALVRRALRIDPEHGTTLSLQKRVEKEIERAEGRR